MMPNKTIYVADADAPVFERAQELAGGNLSAVIARALRLFVQAEEANSTDVRDVTVKVGDNSNYQKKLFRGRLLAKWQTKTADDRHITQIVYHTAKGKLAVYTKDIPNWSTYDEQNWESWDWSTSDYKLLVFDTLADLQSQIPPELYDRVARKLSGEDPDVEVLDI